MSKRHPEKSWGDFLLGGVLILLGAFMLWAQVLTTFVSVYLIGWVLLIAGIVELISGFTSQDKSLGRFLTGVVSLIFGFLLITNPFTSAVTLTLLIGILFLVSGTYRMAYAASSYTSNAGWHFGAGVLAFILGSAIILQWPVSGLYVIGIFLGIELLTTGILLMAQPAAVRAPMTRVAGIKGGRAARRDQKSRRADE